MSNDDTVIIRHGQIDNWPTNLQEREDLWRMSTGEWPTQVLPKHSKVERNYTTAIFLIMLAMFLGMICIAAGFLLSEALSGELPFYGG